MRVLHQIAGHLAVFARARRNRVDLVRAMIRRPQLLLAIAVYEVAGGMSARVDTRLKILAELKVAALVNCEYCLDIGSALARGYGLTATQLQELATYPESAAYDEDERLVLELAEALTGAPAVVADDLRSRLNSRFSPAQVAELTAAIVWENHRARLNQGLGVRPSGFSDGLVCARPEPA